MDIAAWLRGLGLECYEQAFRANDVDAEVLPELTAEDLAAIGVTSAGHRHQLLAAIAALRNEAAVGRTAEPHPKPVTTGPNPAGILAEIQTPVFTRRVRHDPTARLQLSA